MRHAAPAHSFARLARRTAAWIAARTIAACIIAGSSAFAQEPFALGAWAQPVPRHSVLSQPGYYVWGGSVVEDGGRYHMFYSRWPTTPWTFADGWLFASEICHAVANTPDGPFAPTGVVLGRRANDPTFAFWDSQTQHNPHIRKFGNRFYLYYMASVDPGTTVWPGITQRNRVQRNQRIGVITANTIQDLLAGNFARPSAPIVSPVYSTSAANDRTTNPTDFASNRIVNNQTVIQRPDGRFQLIYKSNWPQSPGYGHGYALADFPEGPFTQAAPPIFSDQGREDENHWYDAVRGRYFLLCKNFAGGGTEQLESFDSVSWTSRGIQFGNLIRWADGVNEPVEALERPQLLRDANGDPEMVYMACRRALAGGQKEAFNVHIPLRPPVRGATAFTSPSEIATSGRLVRAVNLGATVPITLNGLSFEPSGDDPLALAASYGFRQSCGAPGAALAAGLVDPLYAGLPEFEDFLDTQIWQTQAPQAGAATSFDLAPLTPARRYRLQLFLAESRIGATGRHGPQSLSIGGQAITTFDYGPLSSWIASGATAIRIEATFVATAPSLAVTLAQLASGGGGLQLSAFALHDVTPASVRWRADGTASNQLFGRDTAGIGDVDGDDRDDVIIVTNALEVALRSGATGAPIRSHVVPDVEVVTGVGDVNGDGRLDYAIGAPRSDSFGFDSGAMYLYSGANGTQLRVFRGAAVNAQLGLDLDGAGDVDADGYADLIVAGRTQVSIFSGRTYAILHSFAVTMAQAEFPIAVRGIGDMNRDGSDDVAIGEPQAMRTLPSGPCACGRVRVLSGRSGAVLHEWWGQDESLFGLAVDGVGDVDRDGRIDVLVGEPRRDVGTGRDQGRIHLFSGASGASIRTIDGVADGAQLGSTVSGVGDLDGDATPDLLAAAFGMSPSVPALSATVRGFSGASGAELFASGTGGGGDDRFGRGLAGAGDVDGDGFPEVIASAPNAAVSGIGVNVGSAFLIDFDAAGSPARSRSFGAACLGTGARLPHAGIDGRPALGTAPVCLLRGAPPSAPVVFVLGLRQSMSLDAIGMNGCTQYASLLFSLLSGSDAGGFAATPALPVPRDPALRGAELAAQWLCMDPAANAFGWTASDGLLLVLGD